MKKFMFNRSGDYQWNKTWDGAITNDEDIGYSIDIDSNGFLYVVGMVELPLGKYNVTLLKYNSSGSLLWTIEWGGSEIDKGKGIIVDDMTNNIYITGGTVSYSGGSDEDVFINKYIEYPPSPFWLDSDAITPKDLDGNFTLSWTSSLRADHYSLYEYSSYITEINGSLTPLIEETTDITYPLTGYTNGTYYFIVKADNTIGTTLSNCIKVEVGISPEEPDDGGTGGPIPGYNLIFLIFIIGFVSTMIIYRRLKLK